MSRWGAVRSSRQPALRARFCVPCNADRPFRGLRCTVCKKKEPGLSKYGAKPKVCGQGKPHHSSGEAGRCDELHWLLSQGHVQDLEAHPQPSFDLVVNDVHIATFRPDFRYRQDGRVVVEDWKGFVMNEVYPMKKRLMKAIYGIEVLETGPAQARRSGLRVTA